MKKIITLVFGLILLCQLQAQEVLAKKILTPSDTPHFRITKFLHSKATIADYTTQQWIALIADTMLYAQDQTHTIGSKTKANPEVHNVNIKDLDFEHISITRRKYALTTEENKSYNLRDYSGKYFELFLYTIGKQKKVNNKYSNQEFISLNFNTYEEANAVLEYLQKKADKNYEKKLATAIQLISNNFKTPGSKSLSTYYLSAKDDFSPANIPTTKNNSYSINNKSIYVEEKTITTKNTIKEKRTQKVELNKLDLESFSVILVDSAFLNSTALKNKKKTKLYLLAIDCKENLPYCISTTVSFAPGKTNNENGLYLTFASAIEAKAARIFLLNQLGK
jgi:hypothetical protein